MLFAIIISAIFTVALGLYCYWYDHQDYKCSVGPYAGPEWTALAVMCGCVFIIASIMGTEIYNAIEGRHKVRDRVHVVDLGIVNGKDYKFDSDYTYPDSKFSYSWKVQFKRGEPYGGSATYRWKDVGPELRLSHEQKKAINKRRVCRKDDSYIMTYREAKDGLHFLSFYPKD